MPWITTKSGKRVNTDWFDDDAKQKERQIKANQDEGKKVSKSKKVNKTEPLVSKKQLEYEEKIRKSDKEHGGFFDKDGNLLMDVTGDAEKIEFGGMDDWDNQIKFNHEIEQRVWRGEEVNFTHNHPENTIFSPEDIEGFESLESHSERAVLVNGTTYTIIREQPRTSNELVWDDKAGEFKRTFEPKKIAPAYYEAYSAIYDPGYKKYKEETGWGTPERQQAIEALDRKVAEEMEKWLTQNAPKYGYRFVKEKK